MDIAKNKNQILKLFLGFIGCALIAFAMNCFFIMIANGNLKDYSSLSGIKHLIKSCTPFAFLKIFSVLYVVFVIILYKKEQFFSFLYQYRYPIAIAAFFFAVLFELSGSSIGNWANFLGIDNNGLLLGKSRMIRSDEWVVSTPMAFSQQFNHGAAFPYFSNTLRGANTDAFIFSGLPVWDIAVLFRPFYWGYLLFGVAKGLSFFWVGRLIALFLVSFELAMVFTKKSKPLSLSFALLIAFAPVVQWWFAAGFLAEMLIFGQMLILLAYFYMNTTSYVKRILYTVGLVLCAGGYALSIYPAWQIPLAYVFAALFIWIIADNYKGFKFSFIKDGAILFVGIALVGITLFYVVTKSMDTLSTVMHTAYPGARLETGGFVWQNFFRYCGNIFFPVNEYIPNSNVCELSAFFDFFPLGFILSVFVMIKNRKKDSFLITLLIANAVLSAWNLFVWPAWLAKLTLLSNSQPSRAIVAVGFINILLLIRAMSLYKKTIRNPFKVIAALVLSGVTAAMSYRIYNEYYSNQSAYLKIIFIAIFILLFVSFVIALSANKKKMKMLFAVLCGVVVFVGGVMVNPIQKGTDSVYGVSVTKEIKQISDKDDGLWAVEGDLFVYNNLPIVYGAPTINSTNAYPVLERWHILDPNRKNETIYNRFAHILIRLNNSPDTSFELKQADLFKVNCNLDAINKLNVKYILTVNDLSEITSSTVKLNQIYQDNRFRIYKVSVSG